MKENGYKFVFIMFWAIGTVLIVTPFVRMLFSYDSSVVVNLLSMIAAFGSFSVSMLMLIAREISKVKQ
jgi:hypothetical protein